ncbi:MAG TPA: hypothetical protein VFA33_07690 [Bryobacteraceae bacterium]|nr:hypothetical protein [Bryobacteraceae bacterium]
MHRAYRIIRGCAAPVAGGCGGWLFGEYLDPRLRGPWRLLPALLSLLLLAWVYREMRWLHREKEKLDRFLMDERRNVRWR